MKTRQEVENLKKLWETESNGWILEEEEGYEEYRDELRAFRLQKEKEFRDKIAPEEIYALAEILELTDNLELVYYIRSLERRIIYLEEKLGLQNLCKSIFRKGSFSECAIIEA